jgi:hypothetical protein
MPCFYCGKRVSLVRQLNDPDFCCDEHRARYHDLTRLALGRLLETRERVAPPAPKRKPRSAKAAQPSDPHSFAPAPEAPLPEPEIAKFQAEPAVEYRYQDSPPVSQPVAEPQAPVFLPDFAPREAGFHPGPGALVWTNPPGAAGDHEPRREAETAAFAVPEPEVAFPQSGARAAGGAFPTANHLSARHPAAAQTAPREFQIAQPVFDRLIPAELPAVSRIAAARIPEPADLRPELPPVALALPAAYSTAMAPFAAPETVCPDAATRGPALSTEALLGKNGPPSAIMPAAARPAVRPELIILPEPALPGADWAHPANGGITAVSGFKALSSLEAVRPAWARSAGAFETYLAIPVAPGLPALAARCFTAVPPPPAGFSAGGPLPHSQGSDSEASRARRGADGRILLPAMAPEIPPLPATGTVHVPGSAGTIEWIAPRQNDPGKPACSPATVAADPPAPAWPSIGPVGVLAAGPPMQPAQSSWIARPAAYQPKLRLAAVALRPAGMLLPQTAPAVRRGAGLQRQELAPLTARPGVQPGKPASPRITPAPEMQAPGIARPAVAAPVRARALSGFDLAPVRGAQPANLPVAYQKCPQPAPAGLSAPLALPEPAPGAISKRNLATRGLAPQPAPGARNVKFTPAVRPWELPAAGPSCPKPAHLDARGRLGRTQEIPYAISPAGKPARALAAAFAEPPIPAALPGAADASREPRLPAAEPLRAVSKPAGIGSKFSGCAWEPAALAVRLPLATAPGSVHSVAPPAGEFPLAAPRIMRAREGGLRAEDFAGFEQPAIVRPKSAAFESGLTPAPLQNEARPVAEARTAAAVPQAPPPPSVAKWSRRRQLPKMRSDVKPARMPDGLFLPLEVPDFDDYRTAAIGAGYPAAGPGPAIPEFPFGPECADRPRVAAIEAMLPAQPWGAGESVVAERPFPPRAAILPRPATPPIGFDFYAVAALPRERGWSLVTSVFRVVLFALALAPASHRTPGGEPPDLRAKGWNTHAVVRVVSDRAAAQWKSERG